MFRNRERTQPGVKQSKRSGPATSTPTTESYPFRLNFYDTPPRHEVTLEDFETCALDRLRVLAEIESSFARNRSWEELKTVTDAQCKKYLPLNSNTALTVNLEEQRRNDHIGHFVLRLAFCRSEELRRRFVKAETTLFRVRYDADSPTDRSAFLERQRFDWEKAIPDERDRFAKELTALEKPVTSDSKNWSTEYHKVPWIRVPDLVAKRRVFLSGGYAYVSSHEVSSFVFNEFERKLQLALEYTAKMLPRLDEDTRLIPILNNLSQGFLAGVPSDWVNPSATGDEIRADMVDGLARKHFPMCMRNMQECLVRDRHLKHFGRLQYGLFLKVLGLSIDEAIAFWKKSLSTIADDRFNKEYRYNIRHSYGLEGKRANYPAKSCQQILTSDKPGVGDCHGCPYRHFSPENLQTGLLAVYSSQGLTANDLHEVMRTVKEGHYHVACTRVFEITHASRGVKKGEGIGGGDSVVHPNQYAARSIELEKSQREDAMAVES
ncbi:DNA primase, large subunit [Boletus edulis BED1]|uniref:DNA primase large subunit n=1 Tax=Boletus edulis BED1 TaxID=1328754 RepID=A0AAD4C3X3_BOLED|nr:DNA primase, large subunit [Boletus edulis BED1]